jgi:hypothetical protein
VIHVLGDFQVDPDPNARQLRQTPDAPVHYALLHSPRSTAKRHRLLYGEHVIFRQDDPGHVLNHLFWHVNSECVWRTGDYFLIHAGAVVTPRGRGVLLPGASGTGKTTLTAALVRAGFGYLSDEAGAIDPVSRRLFPYPKALTFKEQKLRDRLADMATCLEGSPIDGQWHVRADEIRPGAVAGPCEVGYVIRPRYEAGAPTRITPMTTAETALCLMENALTLDSYRGRGLRLAGDIARAARGFTLVSGDLDEAVRAVVKLTQAR